METAASAQTISPEQMAATQREVDELKRELGRSNSNLERERNLVSKLQGLQVGANPVQASPSAEAQVDAQKPPQSSRKPDKSWIRDAATRAR